MPSEARAVVMVGPGSLELRIFPHPRLEKGSMLVRMVMSGICGTDKHGYKGEAIQYAGTEAEVYGPYPAIPGHENVGFIAEMSCDEPAMDSVGQPLKIGDRIVVSPDVLCGKCYHCRNSFGYTWCDNIKSYGHLVCDTPPYLFGGWADYMYVFPGSHVYKVPENVSDEIAVLSEPMAVTYALDVAKGWSALPTQGFLSDDTAVVFGVGPIGLLFMIKARLLGAGLIVAVDKSDFRLSMAREFGADHVLSVDSTDAKDRIEEVKRLTEGRGADLVMECAGSPRAMIEGMEMLRKGGTFLEVGNFVDTGETSINPHRHLCSKCIRLLGMTNLAHVGFVPSMRLLARHSGHYRFDRIVTHRYPLDKAEDGLKKSMALDSMKVVITP